jgi:PKD repeat protein
VAGVQIINVLEVSTTRGLDMDVATADIVVPYPMPQICQLWSRVTIAMTVNDPNATPTTGLVERFVGYIISYGESLWPGAITIHCEDILALAKYTFTPEEVDLKGHTDIGAVRRILEPRASSSQGGVGLGTNLADIHGLNKVLTDFDDVQLFWEVGQTALEAIQMIDTASMGYRTFAMVSGRIVRRFINTDPNTVNQMHHFQEGIDILEGSVTSEIKSPVQEITVTGWDEEWRATIDENQDPFDFRFNSYWIRFKWLREVIDGTWVNPAQITEYILSQISQNIYKVTFTTHIDILFQGAEVIKITSDHLRLKGRNYWVQSVQTTIDINGAFAQSITCVSELTRDEERPLRMPPVEPTAGSGAFPGVEIPTLPELGAAAEPAPEDILVDLVILAIERELATPAAVAGNSGFIYTVTFQDTSTSRQGTIASRAWSDGGMPATGTDTSFTTMYTSLEDAEVTLTVTDSNGQEASITRNVNDSSVPTQGRKLYSCTDTEMYAFDGTEWRSQTPVGAAEVQVVAGGPWWGCGNLVAYSTDDLATPPLEVAALPGGENITAIWKHESEEGGLAVGGADGTVSFSHDSGATWVQRPGPGGAINFIIVSIHNVNEVHVVTPSGWYKSDNEGEAWSLVRGGSFTYLELSHSRNIVVTTDGELQKAEDGTPFTGNTSPIVAATAHIRQDRFYAIAEDGTTWIQSAEGNYELVAGEPIPAGEPYPAGAYRDGLQIDLVYFAAQDGGLFKTLDGFQTADGYMRLLTNGQLTP